MGVTPATASVPPAFGAGARLEVELAADDEDEDELPQAARIVPSSVRRHSDHAAAAQELPAVDAPCKELVDVVILELGPLDANRVELANVRLIHGVTSFLWRSILRRPLTRNRR